MWKKKSLKSLSNIAILVIVCYVGQEFVWRICQNMWRRTAFKNSSLRMEEKLQMSRSCGPSMIPYIFNSLHFLYSFFSCLPFITDSLLMIGLINYWDYLGKAKAGSLLSLVSIQSSRLRQLFNTSTNPTLILVELPVRYMLPYFHCAWFSSFYH